MGGFNLAFFSILIPRHSCRRRGWRRTPKTLDFSQIWAKMAPNVCRKHMKPFFLEVTPKNVSMIFVGENLWAEVAQKLLGQVGGYSCKNPSHPYMSQQFYNASKDETRKRRAVLSITFQIVCNQFCQNFHANGGFLERTKKFVRNTTKPRCHTSKRSKLTNCKYKKNRKRYCFSGRAFYFG